MSSPCASTQASATAPDGTPSRSATALTCSTSARLSVRFSAWNRGRRARRTSSLREIVGGGDRAGQKAASERRVGDEAGYEPSHDTNTGLTGPGALGGVGEREGQCVHTCRYPATTTERDTSRAVVSAAGRGRVEQLLAAQRDSLDRNAGRPSACLQARTLAAVGGVITRSDRPGSRSEFERRRACACAEIGDVAREAGRVAVSDKHRELGLEHERAACGSVCRRGGTAQTSHADAEHDRLARERLPSAGQRRADATETNPGRRREQYELRGLVRLVGVVSTGVTMYTCVTDADWPSVSVAVTVNV